MHSLISVLSEQQSAANKAVTDNFDSEGGMTTFSIPLFDISAPNDDNPVRYCCAPEFKTEADLLKAQAMVPVFPGSSFDTYELGTTPDPVPKFLADLGVRRALPQKLP